MSRRLQDRRNGIRRGSAAAIESLLMNECEWAEVGGIDIERAKRLVEITILQKASDCGKCGTTDNGTYRGKKGVAKFRFPGAGKLFEIKFHPYFRTCIS